MIVKILIFLSCLSLMMSCSDWLDVQPKSQVKEEELFKSESGFLDALTGVYTIMGRKEVYGGFETMGLLDVFAQVYSNVNTGYEDALNYEYEYYEEQINGFWEGNYNAIANCNYVLRNIDNKKEIFSESVYELVKGEILALRAFLHFDLLRGFGDSYGTGADELSIPFVDTIRYQAYSQLKVKEVLEKVVSELNKARDLLREHDPLVTGDNSKSGGIWSNRKGRMNYYGITAVLARVYLYKGDKVNALKCAEEVIESGKFKLVTNELFSGVEGDDEDKESSFLDKLVKYEYISSLYVYNLKENRSNDYFKDEADKLLFISVNRRNDVFGNVGANVDWRYQYLFSKQTNEKNDYVSKYMTVNLIPLVKLSEMYLIAAEASGDIDYIENLRACRGYYNDPLDEDAVFENELLSEYQKEFIAEGQLFYFYKRKNYDFITYSSVEMNGSLYKFPIPDNEYEFGDIKK